VRDADEGVTPQGCLDAFEQWATPTAHDFSVAVSEGAVTRARWPADPGTAAGAPETPGPNDQSGTLEARGQGGVVVKSVDAEITALFSKKSYAAAYAAYAMWPRTCTIFGIAVPKRGNDDLARQVRDRYVTEGFWRMDRHLATTPSH
jgi:hypothetical protein